MKYLVTGGAGFVGSTVSAMLLEHGHEVVVIDSCVTGSEDFLPPNVEFHRKSVQDVDEVLDSSFDGVLHFAGLIAAGESMIRPEIYWEHNLAATLKLLESMRRHKVGTLVFSSTGTVYASQDDGPISEAANKDPKSVYAATKLACDMAIASEVGAYKLAAVSLRYFNVCGAYQDRGGRWYGENHEPETHLIPLAIEAAEGARESLDLYGDDYDTHDGTCIRDYIHVGDLAEAHLAALKVARPERHLIYNLGNGNGFSNREVIQTVERVTGHAIPIVIQPRRAGDAVRTVASSQKANTELSWKPTRSALETMVTDAWKYYLEKNTSL